MKPRSDPWNLSRHGRRAASPTPTRQPRRGRGWFGALAVYLLVVALTFFPRTAWADWTIRSVIAAIFGSLGVALLANAGNPLRGGNRALFLGGIACLVVAATVMLGFGQICFADTECPAME